MQQIFSVVFDRCLEQLQRDLIVAAVKNGSSTISVGLIIGHRSDNVDYVVHLAPCPKYDERLENEFDESGATSKNDPKSPRSKKPEATVEPGSILQHARQALRMLPGGTDILGLYAISDKKKLLENQASLSKLLRSVNNISVEMDREWTRNAVDINDTSATSYRCLLLNVENDTKNLTRNITIVTCVDNRTTSNLLPFTYQKLQFCRLNSTLNLDHFLPSFLTVSRKLAKKSFQIQCQTALASSIRKIADGHVTFNGRLRDEFDQLQTTGKQSSSTNQNNPQFSDYNVQILLEDSADSSDQSGKEATTTSPVIFQHCSALMQFKGCVTSKIQLPAKFTFSEAARSVKTDILRSLYARIELHNEGMNVVEGEELDPEAYHRLPRRVYLSEIYGTGNQVLLYPCDYLFESETVNDSVTNFRDILDINSTPAQIRDDLELVPDEDRLAVLNFRKSVSAGTGKSAAGSISRGSSSSVDNRDNSEEDNRRRGVSADLREYRGSGLTAIYMALGILIGLLACLLYFVFSQQH